MKTLENQKGSERKLNFIGFHETKRSIWGRYRRFSIGNRLQSRYNENTIYYSSSSIFNH